MKFVVSGKKVVTTSAEIEVDADTREQAVLAFKEKHPELDVDFVETGDDSWNVVAQDEVTGEYIFEGDDYVVDSEDGLYFLRKNLPPETADAQV